MAETETTIKRAICMFCHSHCSVGVHIKNGQLIKVEEDREHRHAVTCPG